MNIKQVKTWEIYGAIFSIFLGSTLHFVFAWSGHLRPVALIAAVNESTWEHLKLAFWPLFFWSILEYSVWKSEIKTNFFLAKSVAFFTAPIVIIGGFYGYQLFVSDNLFMDIGLFVVSVIIAQYISFKIMAGRQIKLSLFWPGLAIILILLTFSLLTYFPPRNFLFLDPVTHGYGIIN